MSWSTSRKLLYLLGGLIAVSAVIFYFAYPLIKENPTCTDGNQNGKELGVDCGGTCANLCSSQVRPVSILWHRIFEVTPGVYDVVGYIENQNADSGVPKLLYRFKLYDEKNVLVAERDGKTYLGPNQTSAIFEGQVRTGERVPKRVFLEFEEGYNWVKIDSRASKISFSVEDKNLTDVSTAPNLSASVKNNSLFDLKNVEVVAILRDADDNAIAVSKTVIEDMPKQSSGTVFFTWLKPFPLVPSRIEIVPRVDPFNVAY